jgi:hypothetical protein
MIRRIKRIKPKKRFTPVKVVDPVKTGDEREFMFLPPLEPKKKLLVVMSVVLAVWVAGLILMYAKTVYPVRHKARLPLVPAPTSQPVPATQPADA